MASRVLKTIVSRRVGGPGSSVVEVLKRYWEKKPRKAMRRQTAGMAMVCMATASLNPAIIAI